MPILECSWNIMVQVTKGFFEWNELFSAQIMLRLQLWRSEDARRAFGMGLTAQVRVTPYPTNVGSRQKLNVKRFISKFRLMFQYLADEVDCFGQRPFDLSILFPMKLQQKLRLDQKKISMVNLLLRQALRALWRTCMNDKCPVLLVWTLHAYCVLSNSWGSADGVIFVARILLEALAAVTLLVSPGSLLCQGLYHLIDCAAPTSHGPSNMIDTIYVQCAHCRASPVVCVARRAFELCV